MNDMSEWKTIEKDGKPEEGRYLVMHEEFFCYPVLADFYRGSFTFGPQVYHLPATLPVEVTHYFKLPETPDI